LNLGRHHARRFILGMIALAGCRPASPPSSGVKLTMFGFGLQQGAELRQDALEDFTRKTGIQVELIPTPGTSEEQLTLILQLLNRRATTPDVYLIDIIWPGTLHEHLLDLTPYLEHESRGHIPALLANDTIKDRVVCLPLYMNPGVLYYRIDLLKKYGHQAPPKTWEELSRMAINIQQGERRQGQQPFWGYIWQGAAYEGLTCNALEWQASFGGGHIVESNGSVTVNNPRTAQALRNAASWVGSISPESVLAYTESDTLNVFRLRNAAFMRHWGSVLRRITDAAPAGTVGVAPLPAGPSGRAQGLGGFQLAVSRYSAHPKEAVQLVLYLTGTQVQTRRALQRGYLPTYLDLYQKPELVRGLPQGRVLQDAASGSWVVRPSTVTGPRYAEVSKAYYRSVHAVLARKLSAEVALAALQKELESLTQGPAGAR
jgi:trehalose/maltose transport system substrate-binding protein